MTFGKGEQIKWQREKKRHVDQQGKPRNAKQLAAVKQKNPAEEEDKICSTFPCLSKEKQK